MIKSFLTRFFTSFFILIIFGAIVVASNYPIVFELTIAFLCAMCCFEAINAMGMPVKNRIMIPSIVYSVLLPVSLTLTDVLGVKPYSLMLALTFAYIVVFLSVAMLNFKQIKFNNASTIILATTVITCFLSSIILLRYSGLFYMLLVIIGFAWCTDIFAYLVGMCFGKHRFAPNISPKKTIEGCIGGIVFCLIATFVALFIYQKVFDSEINYVLALVYAFLCSVVGQIGDLAFSYIKRSYGIKDFGKILPGHGGVLDRMDSLIFICPLFYILISLKGFIG